MRISFFDTWYIKDKDNNIKFRYREDYLSNTEYLKIFSIPVKYIHPDEVKA